MSVAIKNLAIAVSFFYVEEKLEFLHTALSNIHKFADDVSVYIFTNRKDRIAEENIKKCWHNYNNVHYTILYPKLLGHPYFLTWSHQEVFKKLVETNNSITHFLYLEDDVYLDINNIEYYIEAEKNLRGSKFIPAFLRYELLGEEKIAIDVMVKQIFRVMAYHKLSDNYYYVNLSYPYQGMYLLSKRYMHEYFSGKAYNPDFNPVWPIREMSTATISFYNVPKGFTSRNLLGCVMKNDKIHVDERALIHHLPNKYVADEENLKKILPVNQIFA